MNLVAIETSSTLCSVALLTGDTVVEDEIEAGQDHSGLVLPMLARLLRARGIGIAEIGGIAFGAGPGSFTGLRIACGIAQGLAAGAGLKVAAVSTLEALAEEAWQDGVPADEPSAARVVACVDARMGEVYHAAYRRESDGWLVCSPPGLYDVDMIPELDGTGWLGVGSGFAEHGARLRARQRLSAERPRLRPHARFVASLARPRFASGAVTPAARALPIYLRDKVALTTSERSYERNSAS
jgi:tRNA threonylcarbamoyladenosine biosynthesis protein TsaB